MVGNRFSYNGYSYTRAPTGTGATRSTHDGADW